MRKVGLLTCYVNNFGACLQAYALQTAIEKTGCVCEIVPYTPQRALKNYPYPVLLALKIRNKIKALYNKEYKFENLRAPKFCEFRKKYLHFGKGHYLKEKELYTHVPPYDCFVVGSDQIWNPLLYGNTNNKAYFLDFAPAGVNRVAYAPSIGVEKIPESCAQDMGRLINKFDAVSVRELSGKRIVEQVSNKECRVVLDPTLLLNADEWKLVASKRIIEKPYIFCYLFGVNEYIGEFVEYVRKQVGLEVVIVPFTPRDYESKYTILKSVGPADFVSLILNAALVITDSFHATAFSINLNTPFYTLFRNTKADANNMNSRIVSILELLDLQDRLVPDNQNFPSTVTTEYDFTKSNKLLLQKREGDALFLKAAIS